MGITGSCSYSLVLVLSSHAVTINLTDFVHLTKQKLELCQTLFQTPTGPEPMVTDDDDDCFQVTQTKCNTISYVRQIPFKTVLGSFCSNGQNYMRILEANFCTFAPSPNTIQNFSQLKGRSDSCCQNKSHVKVTSMFFFFRYTTFHTFIIGSKLDKI